VKNTYNIDDNPNNMHGPNNYKDTKPKRSSSLKNWRVKGFGGRWLSIETPSLLLHTV
jgi:hypothetical protein